MAGEVGFTHSELRGDITLGGFLDDQVRGDALGLDGTPGRRVVARGRELDGGVVGERQDRLHRAFAEGLGTHDHGTLVVLQRAGHDFRRRCRAGVHEHHHGHRADPGGQLGDQVVATAAYIVLRARDVFALGVFGATVGGDHQRLGRQKRGRNADGTMQQAARIITQIEDQTLQRTLLVEAVERLGHVVDRHLLELGQPHIGVARLDELGAH